MPSKILLKEFQKHLLINFSKKYWEQFRLNLAVCIKNQNPTRTALWIKKFMLISFEVMFGTQTYVLRKKFWHHAAFLATKPRRNLNLATHCKNTTILKNKLKVLRKYIRTTSIRHNIIFPYLDSEKKNNLTRMLRKLYSWETINVFFNLKITSIIVCLYNATCLVSADSTKCASLVRGCLFQESVSIQTLCLGIVS